MSERSTRKHGDAQEDRAAIIARFIAKDPYDPEASRARVIGHGVSVLAIVTALLDAGGDMYVVAEEYGLPTDAVRAAVWYYDLNKAVIDARMLLDEAAFLGDVPLTPSRV